MQFLIILAVGLAFIWMPQNPPCDWNLNTDGFWDDIPHTYLNNPSFVYPPWGLILMLPYYLMRAAGSRVISVWVIGWLAYKREWPLTNFFFIALSPYFMVTMTKSNIDILVIVLPILLWETAQGKRWEIPIRGLSLSILLLKPQATLLLIPFLLWTSRKEWKKALWQIAIAALVVIPISLVGSPPLLFQWLKNIIYPSPQNTIYWSNNNISLTATYGLWITWGILSVTIFVLFLLIKARMVTWKRDQTISSLLLLSMYLLPYTSQVSFSSGLAFISSLPVYILQWLRVILGYTVFGFIDNIPLWTYSIAFLSLIFYSFMERKEKELRIW